MVSQLAAVLSASIAPLLIVLVTLALAAAAALWFWSRSSGDAHESRLRAQVEREVAMGIYSRAVPFYVERGQLAEAAALEAKRGHMEEAVRLYERAGQPREAAALYEQRGELNLAALTLAKADMLPDAAALYERAGDIQRASELFEDGGDLDRAAQCAKRLGDLDRAAQLLERAGHGERAKRALAEKASKDGDHGRAGELLEELGDRDGAKTLFQRAGRAADAARLAAEGGDVSQATQLMLQGGEFKKAAAMLAGQGKYREAARAAYKAGDIPAAVGYLETAGDRTMVAKVYESHGFHTEARAHLRATPQRSAQYTEAMEMLAQLERKAGNPKEASRIYETLVRAARKRHETGPRVARWLLALIEIMLEHDKRDLAIKAFAQLDELGLMTDDLRRRYDELRAPPTAAAKTDMKLMSSTLALPQHDRYKFEAKLGQGGNGVVYRATDTVLDRPIVIKMIIDGALPTEIARRWFFREAKVAANLNHPNIVTVHDLAEINGQPYIAMEYVEGETLDAYLKGQLPLTVEQCVPYMEQLAAGLGYAHDHGVVHRDVKFENVMRVRATGVLKLMDFGLATAMQGPDQTVVIAGTPLFMSPEQTMGLGVDSRTDIYAAGVMLFKLLTDRYPYESGNLLEHHRSSPIPDVIAINRALPRTVRRVIHKVMAKDRDERYGHMAELVEDLHAVAKGA